MGADAVPAEVEGKLPAGAEGEEHLDGLKVEELKERCRTAGLKVSGAKAELVARLKEHSSSSSSKEEKKEESKDEAKEGSKDVGNEDAKEESKEEAKEEAKEAEEDAKKDVKGTDEADKSEADAKNDAKEKHEDMLAEDAEEESAHKETADKSKGSADAESDADGQPEAREGSVSKAVDIDSDAEGPPLKIARKADAADVQEDRKASRPSSPAAGNRRSRSRSGSSGSRKGNHRKEEPSKITGNPEDREKARLRMNVNEKSLRMNVNEKSLIRSSRNLKDGDIERILQEHDEDEYGYQTIDFSRNSIALKGVEDVASICKKCPQLKILKLFSNAIDDEGAKKLAEIFMHCKAIEEIHLSHNKFTEKGVETLIEAADEELPKDFPRPLWLRMEHNDIKDPKECVDNIEAKFKSVCPREDRARCLPRACVKGCRIHLPFLVDRDREHGSKGGGKGRDKGGGSYRDNDRWGRNRSPPRRRSPPRQNYRQSNRDAPRGRYNSRSRSPRDRTPPPRRDRASAQDTRRGGGRQQHDGGGGREQPPARRPEASRHESQRPTLTARGAAGTGAYQRAGAAGHESDEYSYEYSDESVEPPPGRAHHSDSGRGRAAPGGARIPPPRDNRDNSRRPPPRSAYHGSSVRMGPSGRTR